jgi:predicted Zn finger-like uncharacterized protein
MLIVCPTCATSYDVDAASLRPNGRQVRCVRCRAVWRAELTQAERLIAAADALAPVRRAVEAVAEASAEAPDQPLPNENTFLAGLAAELTAAGPQPNAAIENSSVPASESADGGASPNDFEVESPPTAPDAFDADEPPFEAVGQDDSGAGEPSRAAEDIETMAARRHPHGSGRKKRGWLLSPLQAGVLALVILDGIIVTWRTDFVRILPQTASFYASMGLPVNLRGIRFDSLAMMSEQHEGVPILVVEGSIVNDAGRAVDVPRLRFAVRNAARDEIYSWTAVPPRAVLSPGEAVSFRTRLASPPPDAHDVLVRFINRIDVLAGSR